MRSISLVLCCCSILACSAAKTAMVDNPVPTPHNSPPVTRAPGPPPAEHRDPKPVVPINRLSSEQKKHLNNALPSRVREFLEKSGSFKLLAEIRVEGEPSDGTWEFTPNRVASITDERLKMEVLNSFYFDVSAGPYPYVCYEPHHGILAEYKGKKIEIDICYSCSKINVRSPFGTFKGGMGYEDQTSEALFDRIIRESGVELKK